MRSQELVYVYAMQNAKGRLIATCMWGPAVYPDNGEIMELFTLTEEEHANWLQTQEQFEAACEHYGFNGKAMKFDPTLVPF